MSTFPTATYRAIRTHFVGPSNTRAARIVADAGDRQSRVTLEWDHALNSEQNHATAALAVVAKMGWDTDQHTAITGGSYGMDTYWVFLPRESNA
jgi:hypothetical protein